MAFFGALLLLPQIFKKAKPTQSNIINDYINAVSNITVENVQSCLQTVNASQDISLQCNVPEALAIAFATSPSCQACAARGNDCDFVCKACVQKDFNQQATYTVNLTCQTSSQQISTIKNSINDQIQQSITSKEGVFGKLLDWLPNIHDLTSNDPNISNETNLTREIQSTISQSNIQQLINNISSQQVIKVISSGGSVQGGVTQNLVFYNTSQLIANNLQNAGIENSFSLTASQSNDTEVAVSGDGPVLIIMIVLMLVVSLIVFKVFQSGGSKSPPPEGDA